jgi:hypothetical protein
MGDAVKISDALRVPITAERRTNGGVALRGHFRGVLALSESELDRLIGFVRSDDTPRLGRLESFPVGANSRPAGLT